MKPDLTHPIVEAIAPLLPDEPWRNGVNLFSMLIPLAVATDGDREKIPSLRIDLKKEHYDYIKNHT